MAHHGRFQRRRKSHPKMTEVLRICAGTKMAWNADGSFFPVDDDDPRGTLTAVRDIVAVNGKIADGFELVYSAGPIMETWML